MINPLLGESDSKGREPSQEVVVISQALEEKG